jgi:hypothetical protein
VLCEVGDRLRGIPFEFNPAHMLPQRAYHGPAFAYPRGLTLAFSGVATGNEPGSMRVAISGRKATNG